MTNDDNSNILTNSKIINGIKVDSRSASFQPSIIRRRDGNKISEVDLQNEMIQNIKLRRQSMLNFNLV
jgi:hypothetical protein